MYVSYSRRTKHILYQKCQQNGKERIIGSRKILLNKQQESQLFSLSLPPSKMLKNLEILREKKTHILFCRLPAKVLGGECPRLLNIFGKSTFKPSISIKLSSITIIDKSMITVLNLYIYLNFTSLPSKGQHAGNFLNTISFT